MKIAILFISILALCSFGLGLMAKATLEEEKKWNITYRIDEDGKRGTPKKTVVSARSSSEAKKMFREENPKAVIISCTERIRSDVGGTSSD